MIVIQPGHEIRHSCGLYHKNTTREGIVLENDKCPQCGNALAIGDVSGWPPPVANKPPEFIKWTLVPLPGMAFKNEFGSSVTLQFEKGREVELFQYLFNQLNNYIAAYAKAESIKQETVNQELQTHHQDFTVTQDGEIVPKNEVPPTTN